MRLRRLKGFMRKAHGGSSSAAFERIELRAKIVTAVAVLCGLVACLSR